MFFEWYALNIGAEGTDGPGVTVTSCNEGLEGAAVNVFSGSINTQSTDDCINAANADLSGYSYELNISGGTTEMPNKNMQNGQPGTGGQPNGKEPPSGEERPDGEERPAQGGFGGASLLTQGAALPLQTATARRFIQARRFTTHPLCSSPLATFRREKAIRSPPARRRRRALPRPAR